MLRTAAILTALTVVLGYAVTSYGGVLVRDRTFWLLAVGLTGLLSWSFPAPRVPVMERRVWIPMALLPGYLLLQIFPLPLFILRVLSPARAELLHGLTPLVSSGTLASLSVAPAATFGQVLRVAAYLIVFLLVREAICHVPDQPWVVALPLVLVGSLEAVMGLMQYAADPASGVAKGTYINRNHFAGLLEMVIPFAVMYVVSLSRRTGRIFTFSGLSVVAVAGTVLVILLAIVSSLSRMGFVATVCGLFIVGLFLIRAGLLRRITFACTLAAILLILVALPPDRLILRFSDAAGQHDVSRDVRRQVWTDTLHLIAAYPVFGCGAGAYAFAYPKYQSAVPFYTVDFAHNDYLQAMAELGLIGVLIVAFWILQMLVKCLATAASEPLLNRRTLGIACAGAWTAILVHSFSEFNLYIPANAMLLAWIAGITAGLAAYKSRNLTSIGNLTFVDVKPVVVR